MASNSNSRIVAFKVLVSLKANSKSASPTQLGASSSLKLVFGPSVFSKRPVDITIPL